MTDKNNTPFLINKYEMIDIISKKIVKQMSLESLEQSAYTVIYDKFDSMERHEILEEINKHHSELINLVDKI